MNDPVGVMTARLHAMVMQATQERAFVFPERGSHPAVVHAALLEARSHLDRLETILSEVTALRVAAQVRARELEDQAQDEWDKQAKTAQQTGRREFEGARERYAMWDLATINERIRARDARKVADLVSGTEDRIRLAYRGLDGMRQDLLASLRYLAWESVQER